MKNTLKVYSSNKNIKFKNEYLNLLENRIYSPYYISNGTILTFNDYKDGSKFLSVIDIMI